MIKIENVDVYGWEAAIRGMRNPMNSWNKSDSCKHLNEQYLMEYSIGNNDHDLMMRLRNAGTDHRKFMRMIAVYADITAPLYWFKEFDTYKVGTVANSCSTMHRLTHKQFELYDFSFEKLIGKIAPNGSDDYIGIQYNEEYDDSPLGVLEYTILALNKCREKYLETKDKKYWWQMIQLLPSSYNQRRTVMLNYEVLTNIYKSRKDHKLDEWVDFCKWIETLQCSELITGVEGKR